MDAVKGRMQRVWLTEDNSRDRMIWRQTICFGKPKREKAREEDEEASTSDMLFLCYFQINTDFRWISNQVIMLSFYTAFQLF